jgi:hypothetical protein
VLFALFICALPVSAQTIESVLMPGPLIKDHAKVEQDCKSCHVRFERAGQDPLCIECHKDVGADFRDHAGFHGRLEPVPNCRQCHTEHRGRDAKIAQFDAKTLDHQRTDFELRGKHRDTECQKCHVTGKKYRDASHQCSVCHKKDDLHKGGLGTKCADCHNETKWQEVDFDHGKKTHFPLTGAHADKAVKCDNCHVDGHYKDTTKTCIGCHKADDDHKGQFGEKCNTCHTADAWEKQTFSHNRDTKFELKDKHQQVVCTECHKSPLYTTKTGTACWDCHRKDDKHKESLGRNCAACHFERGWKELGGKFDHDKTRFPLRGGHAAKKVECKDCHKDLMYRQTPNDCIACHKKDDKHEGNLGRNCNDCHAEVEWKKVDGRFDHQKTKFPLRGAHATAKVECKACHKDLRSYRGIPGDCYSCHEKDDKHEKTEGKLCEQCHGEKSWRIDRYDHTATRFPLIGRHITTPCKDCHVKTLRFKDAARDCWSCHRKDDKVHKETLGTKCEDCHNTRAWSVWQFDHDRKTKYPLVGSHRKVDCIACHKAPAPAGKAIAALRSDCVDCHRKDDVHDGRFGARCGQCHVPEKWRQIRKPGGGAASEPASAVTR